MSAPPFWRLCLLFSISSRLWSAARAQNTVKHSHAQCIGLNPQQEPPGDPKSVPERQLDRDWLFHSCIYENLCYNPRDGEWRLYTGQETAASAAGATDGPEETRDTAAAVSVGAINPRWTWRKGAGTWEMQFKPREIAGALPTDDPGFRWAADVPELAEYQRRALGAAAGDGAGREQPLWLLWHSMAAHNIGHMLWDDLLPLYLLEHLFGASMVADKAAALHEKEPSVKSPTRALPLRFSFPKDHFILWATCEFLEDKTGPSGCDNMLSKWLPGLGHGNGAGDASARETRKALGEALAPPRMAHDISWAPEANLVCFPWAAAGVGMLSDHCTKLHGWDDRDYFHSTVCNSARGGAIYAFRSTMVDNLLPDLAPGSSIATTSSGYKLAGVVTDVSVSFPPQVARRIVFVTHSSRDPMRSLGFDDEIAAALELPGWEVVVLSSPHRLSAAEQVYLAATTAIWVTACGGAAATAMFLPRGATIMLYYGGNRGLGHAYLDWDIFAHMSYLNTIWLPSPKVKGGSRADSAEQFRQELRREVDRLEAFIEMV